MSRHLAPTPAQIPVGAPSSALVSGRAALTDGTCPLHGPGPAGEPCARFAHLRADGRTAVRPSLWKRLTVPVRRGFKPVAIFALVGGFGYLCWQLFPQLVGGLPGMGR